MLWQAHESSGFQGHQGVPEGSVTNIVHIQHLADHITLTVDCGGVDFFILRFDGVLFRDKLSLLVRLAIFLIV